MSYQAQTSEAPAAERAAQIAHWRGIGRWLREQFLLIDGDQRRLVAMEGVRGVSIMLVFFVHFGGMVGPWLPEGTVTAYLNDWLALLGHQGVELFFIISGFLMYSALISKPRPYLPFLKRRIQRLYPAFLGVFVLYLGLSWIFPNESSIPAGRIGGALYIAANALMLPGIFRIEPMITVAWSLSYEVAFYTTLPGIISVFRLRALSPAARMVAMAILGLGLAVLSPRLSRMAMFAVGMLLAEFMRSGRSHRLDSRSDTVIVIAAIVAMPLAALFFENPTTFGYIAPRLRGIPYVAILSIVFFPLCLSSFVGRGFLARVFSTPALRALGNMSYSYYLLHGLTLKGFFLVFSRAVPRDATSVVWFWLLIPPAFLLTCVTSSALYLLIERPLSIRLPTALPART